MFRINVTQYVNVLRGAYPTTVSDSLTPEQE